MRQDRIDINPKTIAAHTSKIIAEITAQEQLSLAEMIAVLHSASQILEEIQAAKMTQISFMNMINGGGQ